MTWVYSEPKYDPSILPEKPYVVTAKNQWSEIRAHGATPEEARANAENGAARMDSQALLFPWKVAPDA